jgi:hypothetical protein
LHGGAGQRRGEEGHGGGGGGGGDGGGGYGGGGGGHGGGGYGGDGHGGEYPMATIQTLMQNRQDITREFFNRDTGVSTVTTGNTDEVTDWIYQHVEEMMALTKSGGTIRNWDPLFQKLFQHSNELHLDCDKDERGVVCNFTGDTECAIDLAQAHAQVISLFLANGPQEVQKDHGDDVPDTCG